MDSPLFFSHCCKYFFLMTRELTRLMPLRIVPCIHEIIDWPLNIHRERKISSPSVLKRELGQKSMSKLLKNTYRNYIAGVGPDPKSLMSNNFVLLWNCMTCAPHHVPGDQCWKAIQQKCWSCLVDFFSSGENMKKNTTHWWLSWTHQSFVSRTHPLNRDKNTRNI